MRCRNAFEDAVVVGIIFFLVAGAVFGVWMTVDGIGIMRLLLVGLL